LCGLAAVVLGCQNNDEIRRYQVPREAPPRMLAAILPHGERTWFFKLTGPAPVVGEHKAEFERFVQSVRFPGEGDKPTWAPPEGWREVPEPKLAPRGGVPRFATFALGPRETPLELTVTPLGKEAADVLPNVNRWRGQLGLGPLTEDELPQATTKLKAGEDV